MIERFLHFFELYVAGFEGLLGALLREGLSIFERKVVVGLVGCLLIFDFNTDMLEAIFIIATTTHRRSILAPISLRQVTSSRYTHIETYISRSGVVCL
jgi:hypothetical protein